MKRKMLISIALICIMLLNCIMPLIPVHADVSSGDIVLNTKLYKAVKNELMARNIPFTYSDTEKSISIESEVMAQITKLNLNNKGLSNISGLENFTALNHLELSGNSLSEDSNLDCLSGLPLEYLDLSTNKIGDVSDIEGLISTINSKNGKVVLSNQSVSITATSEVTEDGTIKVELPKILSKAGFIKSSWKTVTTDGPSVVSWPDRVSSEGTSLEFNTNLPGLLKLEIYIYDNPTEAESAANLNKASENVLFKSKFTIYVVVHPEETTAIHIPDVNMYREVRRQLTQGKIGNRPNSAGNIEADGYTPNKNLSSYPYAIDENGEIMYEECTFETDGELIHLTVVGTSERKYTIANGYVYLYETSEVYTTDFEQTVIFAVDETGNITQKLGYKIPVNSENETLYDEAYDEPQVFVINNQTLMNKITSLILNNKQIRDITGIEYFVGLKSDLNLSQNYLSNIDPLYELQKNKDIYEDKLQAKYNKYLLSEKDYNLSDALNKTTSAKNAADGNIKSISETVNTIFQAFVDTAKIQKYETNEAGESVEREGYEADINAKIEEIRNALKLIYGSSETDPVTGNVTETKGYIESLDENLLKASGHLSYVYNMLSVLYDIYNNEYKLLTMLTDDMNYMDIEEYEKFDDLRKDVNNNDSDKALVRNQISKLIGFESAKNLTHLEKQLLSARFGIDFTKEGAPLAERFEEVDNPALIDVFREIALYSEMANYCTIKRMENATVEGQCYCAEYLRNRIKEFEYEGIPTDLEAKLLIYVENMESHIAAYVADSEYATGDTLLDTYIRYCAETIPYTDGTDTIEKDTCHGEYDHVTKIERESSEYTSYSEIYNLLISRGMEPLSESEESVRLVFEGLNGVGIPKDFALYEYISSDFKGEKDRLYLYNEVITIADRLVKSNVERYVFLPKLKKLDISYNADLDGIAKISELKSLREFYANADYLGNIQDVNWENLRYVRKLGLAYNYITDITCLNVLDHLVNLDVSHNLLAGRFEFNFENSQKTLQNLDLSYNQIDDITVIQEFLDIRTNGNYANYLAKDYTLNIYLNNQNLNIVVEEPINLKEFPSTVNIEMPKIFTQLLAIDTERTSFGITSEDGRIESEGTYVTLNTVTEGDKTAKVNVIAQSGNGTPVETCVGEGTVATIKYKVVNPKVTEVKVTPNENVVVKPGQELQLTAEVVGENLFSADVVWKVKENQSENTTISDKGLLKIAEDETAEKVVVEVISKDDNSKVVTIEVSTKDIVPETPGTTDPENPGTTDPENPGTTDPENPGTTDPENPGTTDPENPGTTDPENPGTTDPETPGTTDPENPGTTDPENPGTTDPENPGTTEPENPGTTEPENPGTTDPENPGTTDPENPGTTDPENPGTEPENPGTEPEVDVIDTATLGYKAGEEYLTNVKAKTSVEDFAKVLLAGKEYNVVVKKEDKDGNKTVVTEGNIGTGMYVQVQDENGNVIKDQDGHLVVYEIVVKGDVNGDGLANSLDSIVIKAYRNEVTTLSGSAKAAADINEDGKVNVADSKLLLYHRAEVTGYDLNFKK